MSVRTGRDIAPRFVWPRDWIQEGMRDIRRPALFAVLTLAAFGALGAGVLALLL